MTATALDDLLELLQDGQWHAMREVETKIDVPFDKLIKTVGFLSNFDLIEKIYNDDDVMSHIKLHPKVVEWYTRIREIEKHE